MNVYQVGFFREMPYGSPDAPSLYDSLTSSLFDENKIVQYLKSAVAFIFSPGVEEDILIPGKVIGSISILTDGIWAWPDSLRYYLESYHVALPEEFLTHVRNRNYVAPDPDEINIADLELSG